MTRTLSEIFAGISEELTLFSVGGCSAEDTLQAEAILGVKFPNDFKEFSRHFGSAGFGSTEVFGVTGKAIKADAVAKTLLAREREMLPLHLVVIRNLGDGSDACLDCSDGKGSIILWDFGESAIAVGRHEIAKSFFEFLEQRVEEENSFFND